MPNTKLSPNGGRRRLTIIAEPVAALLGAAFIVAALLVAPSAWAAGFEIPGNGARSMSRGNAFAVRADDLSALAHNPAGLVRNKGLQIYLNHQTVRQEMSFTRAESVVARSDKYPSDPFRTVENSDNIFALGGMFVAAHDLGIEGARFALGIYGPSASGKQTWPVDGGQRYMMTGIEMLLVYYSAAVAYGGKDWGVGATFQYAQMPLTRMTMVVDGSPGGDLNPYYGANDVEAVIELKDNFAYSAILGAWYRISDNLEVALSGRVLPVRIDATGDTFLRNIPGQTQFPDSKLQIENSAARMSLVIPPTATLGFRYVHQAAGKELFDVEFDLVYEAWSMMEQYKVELDGTIKLFAAQEAPDVVIAKKWRDTLSARLGATFKATDMLDISAGGYYEQGAVPVAYTHVDFPSFDRIGLGLGATVNAGSLQVTLAYNHVMQDDRVVDEKLAKVFQVRPLSEAPAECGATGDQQCNTVPANAGTLKTAIQMASISVGGSF